MQELKHCCKIFRRCAPAQPLGKFAYVWRNTRNLPREQFLQCRSVKWPETPFLQDSARGRCSDEIRIWDERASAIAKGSEEDFVVFELGWLQEYFDTVGQGERCDSDIASFRPADDSSRARRILHQRFRSDNIIIGSNIGRVDTIEDVGEHESVGDCGCRFLRGTNRDDAILAFDPFRGEGIDLVQIDFWQKAFV